MAKSSKPWLKYHKPGAPVREFHDEPKSERKILTARFWLIFGSHIGAHQFYLWRPKSAAKWFLAYLTWAILFDLIPRLFESHTSVYVAGAMVLLWIVVVMIEFRKLPHLVKVANERVFGEYSG